jgi:DNA helicase HerA-like ATPase
MSIEENVTLPPPGHNQSIGEIPIGNILYPNQPPREFSITFPELTRHMGFFGTTGPGKTTLANNILFIVFDWERNYRDLIRDHKEVKISTIGTDISPFYFKYFKMPEGIPYKESLLQKSQKRI